jgi:hypothetical protein
MILAVIALAVAIYTVRTSTCRRNAVFPNTEAVMAVRPCTAPLDAKPTPGTPAVDASWASTFGDRRGILIAGVNKARRALLTAVDKTRSVAEAIALMTAVRVASRTGRAAYSG